MRFKSGETVLFTGDSITDCGRTYPYGEGDGLGNGYVSLVKAVLQASCPQTQLRILNTGISGNRVTDLDSRWKKDVLDHTPAWVSIFIGINDVWRHFDSPDITQVNKAEFKDTYNRLIEQVLQRKMHLIMMTPYFIEPNRKDPMRAMMDEYGQVVKELAKKHNALLVDVQEAFDKYLLHMPSQSLCGDRVHPNLAGHMIIARSFLSGIGFDWK